MATLVKFLIDKDLDDDKGEVFAYFPNLNYNKHMYGNSVKTGYAHIGQHTSVQADYAAECKLATPLQYEALKNELISIGYELNIVSGKRLIDQIITHVNCQYGAPMGRANVNTCEIHEHKGVQYFTHGHLYDCAVPMNGSYDRGGAYWGFGSQLRVKYNKSLTYVEFYRIGDL